MIGEETAERNLGLICFTETHLCADHLDAEINIAGFIHYRSDRTGNSKRGGVIVYIKEELAAGTIVLASGSVGHIEYLLLKVSSLDIAVLAIYRPPLSETSNFETVIRQVEQDLTENNLDTTTLILTGDLNLPIISWEEQNIDGGTAADRRQASILLNFLEDNFLEQHVNQPTRGNNILDIFSTNNHELIVNITVEDTQMSDHRFIFVNTNINSQNETQDTVQPESSLSNLNFWHKNVNWTSIREEFRRKQ